MSIIRVEYSEGHNFEWDTDLEQIAERVRESSSMDFENMVRSISFLFQDEEEKNVEKFKAIVQSKYPSFRIIAE